MTVIIGLEHENHVYMGGDSISLSGWSKAPIAGEKVFKRSFKSGILSRDFIFGFAGSPRAAQLVEYRLQPPVISDAADTDAYMRTDFIDAVRTCFRNGGLLTTENGQEKGHPFLVGYRGSLYFVGSDFSVEDYQRGFFCIGAGDDVATGAMAALSDLPPEARILKALQVTGDLCAAVCEPYYVEVA